MAKNHEMLDVLFVNKFGPASNAITGLTAMELVDYLHSVGIKVGFLCMKAKYRANREEEAASKPYPIWEIDGWYTGDNKILRLVMSLVDGFRLFLHACLIKRRTVVVMTDPPLLFLWFQLFRRFTCYSLGYYTMDLYPDAFLAGRYARKESLLYRLCERLMYKTAPDWLISLGKEQLEYLTHKFGSAPASIVFPCGLVPRPATVPVKKAPSGKVSFCYGGNVGEAHDADFLIQFIQTLDPQKHVIYLSLYGTKSAGVLSAVENHPAVILCPVLSHADIAGIDISLVSLLPEWDHICVPSKAVTSAGCGSALLLNVSLACDSWQMFSEAAWHIPPALDYHEAVEKFLVDLSPESIVARREAARRLAAWYWQQRESAFIAAADFLRNAARQER